MPTEAATDPSVELGGPDRSGRYVAGGSYAAVGFAGIGGGTPTFGEEAAGEGGTR